MPVVLNRAGYNHALELIRQGKVDRDSDWSISPEEENEILGDPPNWDEYKRWHLGHDTGANPETKEAWKYPFGKGGKVYRRALTAIRQRSAQQGLIEIFNAAGRLLSAIDSEGRFEETDWIPIFQTGTWTDSEGNTRTWTEEDLEEIARSYDPQWHEAPVVIGHPSDDQPAYGWVEALRRVGGVLYAKLRDVAPEFKELVNRGAFKKRSVALSRAIKDGVWYLRHLGFLGAVPPAVKGLADVKLGAPGDSLLEIAFKEEEMEIAKIREELRKELEASFSEQLQKERAERERLMKEKEELERKLRRAELERFLEGLKAHGKLTPALEKLGLVEFMLELDDRTEVTFSEGRKRTLLGFFKEFLERLPEVVTFEEIARKQEAAESEGSVEEQKKLGREIAETVSFKQ